MSNKRRLDLESSLDELQARCLDLETSLARSKRLRRDEVSKRNALSSQAQRAETELKDAMRMLRLELQYMKVGYSQELAMAKKERDGTIAALPKVGELENGIRELRISELQGSNNQ